MILSKWCQGPKDTLTVIGMKVEKKVEIIKGMVNINHFFFQFERLLLLLLVSSYVNRLEGVSDTGHCFFLCIFTGIFSPISKWYQLGVKCNILFNLFIYLFFPHPDPPSHLPLHPIPLGLPSAPSPSTCLMHPTWAGDLFHPR